MRQNPSRSAFRRRALLGATLFGAFAVSTPFFAETALFAETPQSAETAQSAVKPFVIFDAKTPTSAATAQDVSLRRLDSGALEATNGKTDSWPGFHFFGDWNLAGYSTLEAKITNPSDAPLELHCRLDCQETQFPDGSVTFSATVEPGETKIWTMKLPGFLNLETREKLFAMRGKPGGIKTDSYSVDSKIAFNKQTLNAIRIFENQNQRGDRWILESFVALPGADAENADYLNWGPEKFFPMIDRFGQFAHKDWPGKTHSLEELRAQIEIENADLDANVPPERNEYGGWEGGPQLEATGAFRTEKIDGVWYLVDPKGRLFWSNGVDCVGHANGVTPITDREFYFCADIPMQRNGDEFDEFLGYSDHAVNNYYANCGRYWHYNFTASNLYLKFGPNWKEAEKDLAARRLRSWGLNTIGNWSDANICAAAKTPYTATVGIYSPKIEGSSGYWGKFSDPFHPEFKTSLRSSLEAQKDRTANDPFCIGYFVDNEISWGAAGSLSKAALASPKDQPAKIAFVDWLKAKYETIDALNAAWKSEISDWDALLAEPFDAPKDADADCDAFYTILCEKYFSEILTAVREVAPKKLYLGCRFAWSNPLAIAAAQKYCDVVSYNFYQSEIGSFRPVDGDDKPVMIGEFHFGALDRGLFHTGLGPTASQEARAAAYEKYVRSALENPWIVGAHWFQYGDQATTGRSDGENYQIGLVDICDVPYAETIEAVRRVGYAMYDIRSEAKSTDETLNGDQK